MRTKMNRLGLSGISFICIFFLCFLISGCSNPEDRTATPPVSPSKTPTYGGTYQVALNRNPTTLDPAYVLDKYSESVIYQVFDGLVRFDSNLSALPALAETWEVTEKGKVYRFKLKEAVFHNHDPVTSGDVEFTLKRLLRTEPPSAVLQHLMKIKGADEYRMNLRNTLTGIKIENEKNFSIHLKKPHAPFLTALGMYQTAIVPEKAVTQMGNAFGKHPVGSGPFQFVSWEKSKTIQLQRFKEYYGGPAYLDKIVYRIYPEDKKKEILIDFKQNRLDEMSVYEKEKEELTGIEGLQWLSHPSMSLFFYGLNIRHPHLENSDLRKALFDAVDRKALVNNVYNGEFQATKTILPPGMAGYQRLDPIKDTGISRFHGQKLELEIVSAAKSIWDQKEIAAIQEFWVPLGITFRTKYITDLKVFEAYLQSDAVQIYRYAWHADMPDPDSFLSSLFLSDSAHNFMNLKNREIDAMLADAREIVDPVTRAKMYQKIETAILGFTPVIPLFYLNVSRVYQPHVQSISLSPLGAQTTLLSRVWLDKGLKN